MNRIELAASIGNTLTQLDTALMSSELNDQPEQWKKLYETRKDLDDKQRLLIQADLRADNIEFQNLTADIQAATEQLNQQIADATKISSTIRLVSEIASKVDSILSLV